MSRALCFSRDRVMSSKLRGRVWDKTGGHCYYCRAMLLDDDYFAHCGARIFQAEKSQMMHVDHAHPKSRGGSNDFGNLYPSCARCNLQKKAMTVEEFGRYLFARNILPAFWTSSIDPNRDWILVSTPTGKAVAA